MVDISNRERVGPGPEQLARGSQPYVEREQWPRPGRARQGRGWFRQVSGEIRHGLEGDGNSKIRRGTAAAADADRALDLAERLLTAGLLTALSVLQGRPKAGLMPWCDVITPHRDVTPSTTARPVPENCNAFKFDNHGFEVE